MKFILNVLERYIVLAVYNMTQPNAIKTYD